MPHSVKHTQVSYALEPKTLTMHSLSHFLLLPNPLSPPNYKEDNEIWETNVQHMDSRLVGKACNENQFQNLLEFEAWFLLTYGTIRNYYLRK